MVRFCLASTVKVDAPIRSKDVVFVAFFSTDVLADDWEAMLSPRMKDSIRKEEPGVLCAVRVAKAGVRISPDLRRFVLLQLFLLSFSRVVMPTFQTGMLCEVR